MTGAVRSSSGRRDRRQAPSRGAAFPPTQWNMLEQCRDPDAPEYRIHLEELCRRYWPPVFSVIARHWTRHRDEAEDLCQAYFLLFLEKDFLGQFDAEKGRFRTFIRASLRHFLLGHRRAQRRQKRHPAGAAIVSLDELKARHAWFDVADTDPCDGFDEVWKETVVRNVLARMRRRVREKGRSDPVEIFARYRIEHGPGERPTRLELAEEFGLTLSQVKHALEWAAAEFVEALKAEVRDQVACEEDLADELEAIFGRS